MISRHSQTGFKFWEITVVLGIIALMAAVLFPVFQKPHERHHSYYHSNLMQLGLAFVQYTQDADEKMPPGENASGNGWAGQIYSFTKSTGIYHCTEDYHDGAYVSYTENQNLVSQNVSSFAAPAATVELYEFTTLNCDPSSGYVSGANSNVATGPMETTSATGLAAPQDSKRHDAEAFSLNFLAVDGHVKYLKPGKVSSEPNAVSPNTLNPSGNVGVTDGKPILTFAVK